MRVLWLASWVAALAACASSGQLAGDAARLGTITDRARAQGAYRCAPEELALAEAHLEFARHELAEGDPVRARQHLVLAEVNARAALRLSGADACTAPGRSPEARTGRSRARATMPSSATSQIPASATLRGSSSSKEEHASI